MAEEIQRPDEHEIYGMPPGAKYAYVYLMDVETYLYKMLVSDELKESIVKHKSAIEALLCHASIM